MEEEFNGIINIGGIRYTLDKEKVGVTYLFRSYNEFRKTFQSVAERSDIPLQRIQELFIRYFRVEPFVEQDFAAIETKDKKDLIAIFNAYLESLKLSKDMSGDSVISIMLNRTFYEISNILIQLTGKPKDYSSISVTCKPSMKKLKKDLELDPEKKKIMIAEFAWLLDNPEKIRSEAGCKWVDMIAELSDIRLTDMTAQINDNSKDDKTQCGGGNRAMEHRLKSLLMVSSVLNAAKKCGYDNDEDYRCLEQSFSTATMSLYKNIKKMYQPIYRVIENCMKRSHVKKNKIIMPLLQLQHLSNHFIGSRKEAYGIYRIKNPGKRLVSYLTSQLQCISSTLDKMKPAEKRKYHDIQKELSPISPTSLPKRKAVASSKKGVVLPVVQFVTLDGNLTIPPFEQFYRKGSELEKEQYFQVMTDYFTKNNIYMIYSQSDEVPLNFYDISLPSIDVADRHIPVTDYHSKRIIHNHILQDFCTFVPHAIYTNAELVLSIFIALKEKQTK